MINQPGSAIRVSRRRFLAATGGLCAIAGGALACGPATAPTAAPPSAPTAAPAKSPAAGAPAAAPAKPTAAPPTQPAKPKDKVSIRQSFTVSGYHAPFYSANERGFNAANGIESEILDGTGSQAVVQLVANKSTTFGFIDPSTVVRSVSKQAPVKMVAGIVKGGPFGLMFRAESGFQSPKDFAGKTFGIIPGGTPARLTEVLFQQFGVHDQVKYVNADANAVYTLLAEGKFDGIHGTVTFYPRMEKMYGKPVKMMMFSDYGLNAMGWGVVTHTDLIRENPDLVRRFVAGTIQGWQFAREKPEEAVKDILKHRPELKDEDMAIAELKQVLNIMDTPASRGKPIGWMPAEDWQKEVEIAVKYLGVEPAPPIDQLYTNDFLPK